MINQSKLTPPSPPRHSLHRSRITRQLLDAINYRLTVIQAGAGYGKSTSLAALKDTQYLLVWYQLHTDDADPLRFLFHLLHGFSSQIKGFSQRPIAQLERWNHLEQNLDWQTIIQLLSNEISIADAPVLFVLDDSQLLQNLPETERIVRYLIGNAPPSLHVLLSTRIGFGWDEMITWRARGQVLEISEQDLAFTVNEIHELYHCNYELPLSLEQCQMLNGKTEGWAMILPLVWQKLRQGNASSIHQALEQLSGSASDLFLYLSQETWNQQSRDIRDFLLKTSILNELTADFCNCLCDKDDSIDILLSLREKGFFLYSIDSETMRYHHLFRELLQQQLSPEEARQLHRKAAECYLNREHEINAAIDHYLAAGEFEQGATLLADYGRQIIAQGLLETLSTWIGSIHPTLLMRFPSLLVYLGDIARLHSHFDEALGWYEEAEHHFRESKDLSGLGLALRGQARVYLDTVNPHQAEALLEEALRISDGEQDHESQARLLDLLAENRLNQGRTEEAKSLREKATVLRRHEHDEAALPLRLLLRTGQLNTVLTTLEHMAKEEEQVPVQKPRAHRETLLLLSLVYSFLGEQERALEAAVEGTARGEKLGSLFVTAVGWMRQGHAWLLLKNRQGFEKAQFAYTQAIGISNEVQATRLKVEAYWGLVQVYGFRAQIELALDTAAKGISTAEQVGDEWVAACIRVSMGASLVIAGETTSAAHWLKRAYDSFQECNDLHGQTVSRLWQCLLWNNIHDSTRLVRDLNQLLLLIRENDYDFLLFRKTLLGPPDLRAIVPLLIQARELCEQGAFANHLLDQIGLASLQFHPGYQLRIRSLGRFRVWQGQQELESRSWRRQKARQLFQLLLTYRRTMMHREQITEILWPDVKAESAARDFKVAYAALRRALEPNSSRKNVSAFLVRDGSRYGIRPEADLWFDVTEFDQQIAAGDRLLNTDPQRAQQLYQSALSLYEGGYLQEFPYEEWADQERRRLLNRYLRTAERLGRSLIVQKKWDQAIGISHALLEQDNCWEPAYQMLIVSYAELGNRSEAIRTYLRCEQVLQSELDVSPSVVTSELYRNLQT
ncbi:MAG: BTAD domain-containing putative transcriptional regulator [Candidatus Promineifilaceae bacterium]|nr:BTAD domain-containing putative transcriptional regulator [Candidatus Promineifilaceae bacterium]